MPLERDKPHIVVPGGKRFTRPEEFRGINGGSGSERELPPWDRAAYGRQLRAELDKAFGSGQAENEDSPEYRRITFVSFPGLELALESLEPSGSDDPVELLGVKWEIVNGEECQLATVYIPSGRKKYFFRRLDEYVKSVESGEPDQKAKHAALIEGIQSIRRASVHELWTDPDDDFPGEGMEAWWEVWLRRGQDRVERFISVTGTNNIRVGSHFLGFGDRIVALAHGTVDNVSAVLATTDDIAELRRPHEIAIDIVTLSASEQAEWVRDLADRLTPAGHGSPTVCILDHGVQQRHPLLSASLDPVDCHAIDPTWTPLPLSQDSWPHNHGTEMAGIALYGDLEKALASSRVVRLAHRLESVKFLPDTGSNDPDLWGAVTAQAVDRPEIQEPARPRVFMMAVTAQTSSETPSEQRHEEGRPTAWSASIDALTCGRAIDNTNPIFTYLDREEPRNPRLFIISAGNIRDVNPTDDHLSRSDSEQVEDPGQAWNAITVGAYTDKTDMSRAPASFAGYSALASQGELSPVSRTSVPFDRKRWPFKPEVVAEGGNLAVDSHHTQVDTPENLAVLTTRLQTAGTGFFTTTRDTSAATAQVAAIAADIQAAYPSLKPETIRGLIVHSAEWTPAMHARVYAEKGKTDRVGLLRRYGMGVPDLTRACRSAGDALTLVLESHIHPYKRKGHDRQGSARQMNLHPLPWPIQALEELDAATVRLRVTLSYFIEPNPSSRGWSGRYLYPSHGLRFAMKRADDTLDNFRMRTNLLARPEGIKPPSRNTEKGWLFGSDEQNSPGSLHTDIWEGTARELAAKEAIAVYPVSGWWKNRPDMDQSDEGVDYSLIVSIQTPDIEADLYTPVAQMVAVPISAAI